MYLHEKGRKHAAQGMLLVDVDISDLDHPGYSLHTVPV